MYVWPSARTVEQTKSSYFVLVRMNFSFFLAPLNVKMLLLLSKLEVYI